MNTTGMLFASGGTAFLSLLDNLFRGGSTFTGFCILWNVLYWSYIKLFEE